MDDLTKRVVRRYLQGYDANTSNAARTRFPKSVEGLKGRVETTTNRFLLQDAWVQVINDGRKVAEWVVATRSISPSQARELELASRVVGVNRTPDVSKWWEKNQKALAFLLDALTWPDRATEGHYTELFDVGPLKVHNTLGLVGPAVEYLKKFVGTAVQHLQGTIFSKVLYGDVYVVGQLSTKANRLAWYVSERDDVYVRPQTKYSETDVEALVHELGHRWWFKFASQEVKKAWAAHHLEVRYSKGHTGEVQLPKIGDLFLIPVKGYKTPPMVVGYTTNSRGSMIQLEGGGLVSANSVYNVLHDNHEKAKFPTAYSAKDKEEHFAESFCLYVVGKLTYEHLESFERIVVKG